MGIEISPALVGRAHVAEEQVQNGAVQTAAFVQLDRRDDNTFLDQLPSDWHRTGRHAADVRVMGARGNESHQRPPQENGRDQGYVRQMRTAEIGVVQDGDVARREGGERHRSFDGRGHRAQVDGDVSRLRHEPALRVKYGA